MSFSRYPKYKPSGVTELGEVPEHWGVKPLKHLAGVDSSGSYGADPEVDAIDHTVPVATTAQIDSDGRFVVADMPLRGFTESELQRYGCADGDVLVVKSSGSATNIISGKAGLVTNETPPFIFSNFLMRIRPRPEFANSRFIYALLRSHLTRQRVEQMCSTTTYPNLKVSEYTSAPLPIPPVAEQALIATFLDRETSKIDALVGEQRRLIELLKEKRLAVISHAVTKGLNPHAPMKPSGIEWLGDVPEHWEVMRVKHVTRSIEQGWSPQCEGFPVETEAEWGVLKVGCVNGGKFNCKENKVLPLELEPISSLTISSGDLLISRANTRELVGSAAVAEKDYPNLLLCDKLYRLRLKTGVAAPMFLSLYLGSNAARGPIELGATGASASMVNIGQSIILELELPVPPIREQESIVAFLDAETAKLDALTAEAERAIELLQERRTALISAAVTGKIDVRSLDNVEVVA